jgi:hypothetical protein
MVAQAGHSEWLPVAGFKRQEAECPEVSGTAFMRGRLAMCGSYSIMNLQGFPRDFLLKFKPELEQAESAEIASPTIARAPISNEGGFLTVSPLSTDELGVVEIVIRIKLSTHDAALVDTHRLDPRPIATKTTVDAPPAPSTWGEI